MKFKKEYLTDELDLPRKARNLPRRHGPREPHRRPFAVVRLVEKTVKVWEPVK